MPQKQSRKDGQSSSRQRTGGQTRPNGDGQSAQRISVNEATAEEIARLRGVGPKTAEAIVKYREKHGRIKSGEELLQISGVGKSCADNLTSQIQFD